MKKILALVAGLVMMASASFAADAASTAASTGGFVIAPEAGIDISTAAGSNIGFGGGVFGGFDLGSGLVLGADVDFFTESNSATADGITASTSDNNFDITADAKYSFGSASDSMKPFVIGGVGFNIESVSIPASSTVIDGFTINTPAESASATNPMILGGAGLAFNAGKDFDIFVEAKIDVAFASGATGTDIPVLVGASF